MGAPVVLLAGRDDDGLAPFLRHNGFGVEVVEDPGALARALAAHAAVPCAVLLDLDTTDAAVMPTRLRAIAALRPDRVPLFGVGGASLSRQLLAIRGGATALFPRPLVLQHVADVLDQHLRPSVEEPYRILVVEDSKAMADYIASCLHDAGILVEIVTQPLDALERMRAFGPDLVLTDMYMPTCSGPELATLIRMNPAFLGIPVVYLSSEKDEDRQVEAMRSGADDFLEKPIRPEVLVASVQMRCERTRLLRAQMLRDSLTGLYNHTSFKDRIASEVARARRQRMPLSVAMVDIDHFKAVNDTYGHAVGDAVIVSLARLLRRRMRQSDVLGRVGGEEFGLLLPDTPITAARRVLDELRMSFRAIVQRGATTSFSATFSCGLAALRGDESPMAVLNAADAALYQAKRDGRDRVVCRADDVDAHPPP